MGNSLSELNKVMKKIIALIVLIVLVNNGFGQVKTFLNYSINDIKFDIKGNYYVTCISNTVPITSQLIKYRVNNIIPFYIIGGSDMVDYAATVDGITSNPIKGDLTLNSPKGFAIDNYGKLYISDCNNNRIRTIDFTNNTNWNYYVSIYSTVNIKKQIGYSGDNSSSVDAKINNPDGIAFDSYNNLYFVDVLNNCIRKVDNKGIITTFAGNGAQGFSGDGDSANKATLFAPTKIAFDSYNNLYICDSKNHRIRVVKNGIISTFAGNGKIGFNGDGGKATDANLYLPTGICVDYYDNIFIADSHNSRVRVVKSDGTIHTLVGNGKQGLTGDSLYNPTQVSLDNNYKLYIVCQNNVRTVDVAQLMNNIYDTSTKTIHDTITNTIHDTIIKTNTVIKIDTFIKTNTVIKTDTVIKNVNIHDTIIKTNTVIKIDTSIRVKTDTILKPVYDTIIKGIHDTIIKLNYDTIIKNVHDTTFKTDTVYFCNESFKFNIYPNPTQHYLNIEVPSTNENYMVYIYDILGHIIYQKMFNEVGNKITIDVSSLANAPYVIRINNTIKKFIKI